MFDGLFNTWNNYSNVGYIFNFYLLVLGLLMSLPLAVGLKTGQLLFKILPENIFRPVTYSCLIILGATLSFNAYE
jgi:uncharacterized membrane protein YfcA